MATIRKRGDKWQAQIRKLGNLPVSRTYAFKEDAEAWARQSEHAIDVGEAGLTSARSKDRRLLDEFLFLYLRAISPVTFRKEVRLFSEQLWFQCVPGLHRLQGRPAA